MCRQRQMKIDARARCAHVHEIGFRIVYRHVRREPERTVRAEHRKKPGNLGGIGNVGGRENATIDDGHIVVRDLTPLPAHTFPEPPIVIVISDSIVECQRFTVEAKRAAHDAAQRGHDVPRHPSIGSGNSRRR